MSGERVDNARLCKGWWFVATNPTFAQYHSIALDQGKRAMDEAAADIAHACNG